MSKIDAILASLDDTPSLRSQGKTAQRFGMSLTWLATEAAVGRVPRLLADSVPLFDADAVARLTQKRAAEGGAA